MYAPRSPSIFIRRGVLVATLCLALGCGDKKAKTTSATKGSATATAKATAAKTNVAVAKKAPKPPKLKLKVADLLRAQVMERCALKGGEGTLDALVLAADAFAGRTYQPGAPSAPKPTEKQAAVKQAAVKKAAVKNAAAAKPEKPNKAAPAVPGANLPEGMKATPTGRTYLADAKYVQWLADYAKDKVAAATWPAWKKQIDTAVKTCLWAPEFGLIDQKLIDRYIGAFVEITCLQDKHRDARGQLDEVAHAHAAIEVFTKNDFNARSFSRIGLIMARFPTVQTALHATRAKLCPDSHAKLVKKAKDGKYVGVLKGSKKSGLKGVLNLTAKDGALLGELVLAPSKRRKKAITFALSGIIQGDRLHLNGVTGQDWLRLDCDSAPKGCDWAGVIGFKKRKGTWSYKRAPVAAEAPGALAAKVAPGSVAKELPVPTMAPQKPAKMPSTAPLGPAAVEAGAVAPASGPAAAKPDPAMPDPAMPDPAVPDSAVPDSAVPVAPTPAPVK